MKKFSKGGKNSSKSFFVQRLSSARVVIKGIFGRLKARFGCLRREMDINLKELPVVIHLCFILHNFCKIRQEAVNQNNVLLARNYNVEFQPETNIGYKISNSEASGKRMKNIFFNPLSANFTKWSNIIKQFVGNLPTNCWSVFDHFVKSALKGLNILNR